MTEIRVGLIIIFITCLILTAYGQTGIKFLYFDPITTIMADKKDGVVVVEYTNGTSSTICMTASNDNLNARVVCRHMGYTLGNTANSYGIISTKKSAIGNTLLENIACKGDETRFESCSNIVLSSNNFLCKNHNMDLHVYCSGTYNFTASTESLSCNGKLSDGNQGLLRYGTQPNFTYFCGINRNFGPTEAAYICTNILCIKSNYSRIIEGYKTSIREIGGFNNMMCFTNNTCINVYSSQKDRCTPDTNIAVVCTNDSTVSYGRPSVNCSSTALTIIWDATIYNATIANNFFAIQDSKGNNCTNIFANSTVKDPIRLIVNYGDCDMVTLGTMETIIFVFKVIRMYPKVANIIVYPDELFNVSCTIIRNQTVSQGPLKVDPVALPPSSNSTFVGNILQLFTDNSFANEIKDLVQVSAGSRIFVKVSLVNPPPDLILVLIGCNYGPSKIILIENMCPKTPDVQISSISSSIKTFSFIVTQPSTSGDQSTVTCTTTKCSTYETSCKTGCGS